MVDNISPLNLEPTNTAQFDSIEYVHSQGIVYGDIKPDSFLFGLPPKEGRVNLIDFGLAKPWRDPLTLHTPASN